MSSRKLVAKIYMVLVLALVAPIVIGADDAIPKKDSSPDFAAMIRELQLEVKKIKDEILKMHAELKERQERAERRRALQKQEEQRLQEIEDQNSLQQ